MGENAYISPRRYKPVWTSITMWRPHLTPADGSFDGVSYVAASNSSVLTSRWWFCRYKENQGSAASKRTASGYSFHIPYDYINGTDIKVRFIWTSNEVDAGSETVTWKVGLTKQNGTSVGNTNETQWITTDEPLTSISGEFKANQSTILTYTGSTINNGDKISIIIVRDSGSDSADDECYLQSTEFIYQRQSVQQETSPNNVRMSPRIYRPLFREVCYEIYETANTSGTFNSLSNTTSSVGVLSDRWKGAILSDGSAKNLTFNWIIPPEYKTGGVIKIGVKMFGGAGQANNVQTKMGMCTDSIGNIFGDESDTEYVNPDTGAPTAMSSVAFTEQLITFTFSGINKSGQNIKAGDPVSFIMFRDGANASDNYTSDFVPMSWLIRYEIDEEGDNAI
jgi:hypothetical protein